MNITKKYGFNYHECSAKTGESVNDLFLNMASFLLYRETNGQKGDNIGFISNKSLWC